MIERKNIRSKEITGGSNRSFGIVFSVVFTLIGLFPVFQDKEPHLWALGIAVVFGSFALLIPHHLTPLNAIWTKFGALLHCVMNPLILGAIFFAMITPMGLLMRMVGKRPLSLRGSGQASYWIERNPPGPTAESFNNQF